jgi:hypothetical protein
LDTIFQEDQPNLDKIDPVVLEMPRVWKFTDERLMADDWRQVMVKYIMTFWVRRACWYHAQKARVSDWALFNAKWAISQLYQREQATFDEMKSVLYKTNKLSSLTQQHTGR